MAAIGQDVAGKKPSLNERFILNLKGKDFVLYAGLLDLAHQKGIKRITVDAIQFPTKENGMEAICKATTEAANGEVFTDWGDANPRNVNSTVANHVLRMASTRAKARTLRDLSNIGMTCLEELGDLDDIIGDDKQKNRVRKDSNQQPKTEVKVDEKNQTKAAAQTSEKKKDAANITGVYTRESSPQEKAPANHQPPPAAQAHQEDSEKNLNTKAKISEAQRKAIERLKDIRSIPTEQLHEMFQTQFGIPFVDITGDEAKVFIRSLQQAA